MKRLALLIVPAALTAIASGTVRAQQAPAPPDTAVALYLVTIQNLTRGQPFSPGVLVTHRPRTVIWRLAAQTPAGIAAIAQDGNPDVETNALQGAPGVDDVVETSAPIGRLGGSMPTSGRYLLRARAGDRLSVAVMLICTNDGFTGVDSVPLPQRIGEQLTCLTDAYDAGVEQNTEATGDVVDGCGMLGPVPLPADGNNDNLSADGDLIFPHPGIVGGVDLTVDHSLADHAWNNPVARITVRRIPARQ